MKSSFKHAMGRAMAIVQAAINNHGVLIGDGMVMEVHALHRDAINGNLKSASMVMSEVGDQAARLMVRLANGEDVRSEINMLPRPVIINGRPVI